MQKRYNNVQRNPNRFSFNEFCKMAWQMSNKDDWHYIDFKNHFYSELEALYFKSKTPLLDRPDALTERLRNGKLCVLQFLKEHKNTEPLAQGSKFFTINSLIEAQNIKPTATQVRQAITEMNYEFAYYREPYTKLSQLGVWLKLNEKELPF